VYYSGMSQPKTSPTSLRIPEAIRVLVETWAAERGIPRNAAYVQLIERGLNEQPVRRPGKVAAPAKAEPSPRGSVSVAPSASEPPPRLKLQVGPIDRVPGSLQKAPKGTKPARR
jgi:hypothetical protein